MTGAGESVNNVGVELALAQPQIQADYYTRTAAHIRPQAAVALGAIFCRGEGLDFSNKMLLARGFALVGIRVGWW